MYIVAFNGPPQCGKDTLAKMLAEILDEKTVLPVKIEQLSYPLRRIAYQMVGWNYADSVVPYEEFKKMHFEEFNCSGRQLMIDVSEHFLKPRYGRVVMTNMLLNRNLGFDGIMILSDCGFQLESERLATEVGKDHLLVAQVLREGCSFTGDSREWVRNYGGPDEFIENNGTLEDLHTEARRIYGRMVNQYKRVL